MRSMRMMLFAVVMVAFATCWTTTASLSCLGDDGAAVDSWTGIKGNNDYMMYYYSAASQSFVVSPYTVNQTTQGAIMSTILPLYNPAVNKTLAYVMWNDAPPNGYTPSSSYAHSKGVLATDGTSGFWLTHSMPNWPNFPAQGTPGVFPSAKYAQSMACISVTAATVNAIANTLRVDYPYLYVSNMPSALLPQLNWMQALIQKTKITNATEVSPVTTLAGVPYQQFAKSAKWGMDLWDDLIAPWYGTPMYVETWISGSGGPMSSMCYNQTNPAIEKINEKFDIYEVAAVRMPDGKNWTNTQDHSKWGVAKTTEAGNNQVFHSTAVCIGDMNRMCSQEKRGGGALCTQNAGLQQAFWSIVADVETCYLKNPCNVTSGSVCYWCTATDLTYPPTYYPTQSPLADDGSSSSANTSTNIFGMNDTKFYILTIVGCAVVLGGLIYIGRMIQIRRAKKTSMASKDSLLQPPSFSSDTHISMKNQE